MMNSLELVYHGDIGSEQKNEALCSKLEGASILKVIFYSHRSLTPQQATQYARSWIQGPSDLNGY
jgi:hypothetical protein